MRCLYEEMEQQLREQSRRLRSQVGARPRPPRAAQSQSRVSPWLRLLRIGPTLVPSPAPDPPELAEAQVPLARPRISPGRSREAAWS